MRDPRGHWGRAITQAAFHQHRHCAYGFAFFKTAGEIAGWNPYVMRRPLRRGDASAMEFATVSFCHNCGTMILEVFT